jgi:hypothetical protein
LSAPKFFMTRRRLFEIKQLAMQEGLDTSQICEIIDELRSRMNEDEKKKK